MANAYLGGSSRDIASGGAGIRVDYDQAGSLKNGGAALNHADDRERLLKAIDDRVRFLVGTMPPVEIHRGSFSALLRYLQGVSRSPDAPTEHTYAEQIQTHLERLERLGFDLERISLA